MGPSLLRRRIAAPLVLASLAPVARAQDPLPSWNEGASKQAIVAFVGKVTKQGAPEFVAPSERIAVFDNDGTLWAEQPIYFQFAFAIDRVKALAPQHPEWQGPTGKEPFKSLLAGDMKGALAGGEKALVEMIAATHSGMTTDEFSAVVREWLKSAKHPTTGRPYTGMVYQPMLELLAYLRANGFKQSHIGTLDKALDEATQRGWTVVSMKDDWKEIFPKADRS